VHWAFVVVGMVSDISAVPVFGELPFVPRWVKAVVSHDRPVAGLTSTVELTRHKGTT